jgi:hypothetical protein
MEWGLEEKQRPKSYRCDDGVSIVSGHKVLDLAWGCYVQAIPADKMRRKVVFGSE